ncbi:MAG: fumarylacetoacetate hydrolase family protein [Syntrophomonadaceae bacterium]|nr:fumarylacetoacetate hydrolase family protein [Syntrophomonadaceae bacterium]
MKFVTFMDDGQARVGVLSSGRVSPLDVLLGTSVGSMLDLIDRFQPQCLAAINQRLIAGNSPSYALSDIKLLAPIPYPRRNVFCLGKNYAEHAQEIKISQITDTAVPTHPIYFTKVASPAIGHGDMILVPKRITVEVDYEVELAVVIGKEGVDIPVEEAEEYIFGYTIGNDISARNLQAERKQWFKGKSLDSFCPMGPVLLHKSALPLPVESSIQCRVNGELRQDSNTRNLIFDIPSIISDLSQGMTLKPGDIILTGTPSGVGMGYDPPRYLKDGDKVECYIENIGVLSNRIKIIP